MVKPSQDAAPFDAVQETAVLAMQLVRAETRDLPGQLALALQSVAIQNAIKQELTKIAAEALQRQRSQGSLPSMPVRFSSAEAEQFLRSVGSAGASAIGQDIARQIQNTAAYRLVEQSAQRVATSLSKTPLGVWLDQNHSTVYIVAGGVVLGGAAAMYVTRSGDKVTGPAISALSALGANQVKFKLGTLDLSLGVTRFEPSTRIVRVNTLIAANWKPVQAKLSITAQAVGPNVHATGTGQLVFPLHGGTVGRLEAAVSSQDREYKVGLHVDFTPQRLELNLMASFQHSQVQSTLAGVNYNTRFQGMDVKFGVTGEYRRTGESRVLGTISVPFW